VRDAHLTDLQASSETLFDEITWASSGTDTITGTADNSGKPFYTSVTEDDTSGLITLTNDGSGSSVLSEGPNDWNVDGQGNYTGTNWINTSGAAVAAPVDDDDVFILPHPSDEDAAGNPKSYSILYGLNQSSIDLDSFRVPKSYQRAGIGDPENGFYLKIDVNDQSSPGNGVTVINSNANHIWLWGTHTVITVAGLRNVMQALRLKGTITTLNVLGSQVAGRIQAIDGSVITTLNVIGGSNSYVLIGTSGTAITTVRVNSGRVRIDREITTITTWGGVVTHTTGAVATWNNQGAYVFYNGSGSITSALNNFDGTFDLRENMSIEPVNLANVQIWNGLLTDRGGMNNIVYDNNIIVHGGDAQTESGTTVDYI
jgi:hypothetical protein